MGRLPLRQLLRRRFDLRGVWKDRIFEHFCEADRRERRADAHDRRVERLEGVLGNERRNLAAETARHFVLVDDERAACLLD